MLDVISAVIRDIVIVGTAMLCTLFTYLNLKPRERKRVSTCIGLTIYKYIYIFLIIMVISLIKFPSAELVLISFVIISFLAIYELTKCIK